MMSHPSKGHTCGAHSLEELHLSKADESLLVKILDDGVENLCKWALAHWGGGGVGGVGVVGAGPGQAIHR